MQPKFLTKEERVALALKRRQQEVEEKKQKNDQARKARTAFMQEHRPGTWPFLLRSSIHLMYINLLSVKLSVKVRGSPGTHNGVAR